MAGHQKTIVTPQDGLQKKSMSSVIDSSLVNENSFETDTSNARNYVDNNPFQTTLENPDAIYDNSLLDGVTGPKHQPHYQHRGSVFDDPSGTVNLLAKDIDVGKSVNHINSPSEAILKEDGDVSKTGSRQDDIHPIEEKTPEDSGQPVVEHPEDYPVTMAQQEEQENSQVDRLLHDVKMEGEDPIADDKYYSSKQQHSDDHHEGGYKSQNVHMKQHEYDVVNQGHDFYTDDTSHADADATHEEHHETEHNVDDNLDNNLQQQSHGSVEDMSFINNEDSTRKAGIPPLSVLSTEEVSTTKNNRLDLQTQDKDGDENKMTSRDDTHDHEHDYGKHRHYGLNGQLVHFDLYNDRDDYDEHAHAHHHEEQYHDKESTFSVIIFPKSVKRVGKTEERNAIIMTVETLHDYPVKMFQPRVPLLLISFIELEFMKMKTSNIEYQSQSQKDYLC